MCVVIDSSNIDVEAPGSCARVKLQDSEVRIPAIAVVAAFDAVVTKLVPRVCRPGCVGARRSLG